MTKALELDRLRLFVQLFQPFSQVTAAGEVSHTVLTVWAVDSQTGQYVADPRS
jgi:hypothetical protein